MVHDEQIRYSILKKGSAGEAVSLLPTRLYELGYFGGSIDGHYGDITLKAVRAFQRMNGLDTDGIAGKETQKRLYSDEAIPAPGAADPVDVLAQDMPYLVNKEHRLQEDFIPEDLVLLTDYCDKKLVKIKYKTTRGVRTAVEALVTMLENARKDGVGNWQVSAGYRSFEDQEKLLNNKINNYLKKNSGWSRKKARNAALRTVAEPGCSEHHLGLAFDVNVPKSSAFAGTKQCKWLHEHCWEYGFIVRYQKGKESITGFAEEAWHIRYVGTDVSEYMKANDLCLEEYLNEKTDAEE